MKTFKILSIDGGGLKGVVPLTILKRVEELTGKPIWQSFDLIAGTSTGGLISCALTLPKDSAAKNKGNKYSIDEIMDVYLHRGQEIFPPHYTELGELIAYAEATIHPKYSGNGIEKVFRDILGDSRMNDCLTDIMVCSYDLANNMPLFFKSRSSKTNLDQNILLYDICRATSAGPTFLPAYELTYPNGNEVPLRLCIDGGVFINNPSMGALSEFSKNHSFYGYGSDDEDIKYEEVFVLSIGTGTYSGPITPEQAKNKGLLFWATRISDIMMRGTNKATDYEMNEMMIKGNYLRLSINIDEAEFAEMDRADNLAADYLIKKTKKDVLGDGEKMQKLKDLLQKSGMASENKS